MSGPTKGNAGLAPGESEKHISLPANDNQTLSGNQPLASDLVRHGWALVPIPHLKKGPTNPGWNKRENCITDAALVNDMQGYGLAHAYSGTMSFDIDDIDLTRPLLAEHGIDLDALLNAADAVQINSGVSGHGKLIFKMPFGLTLASKKISVDKKVAYELRCASANGLTVQDCLPPTIHPGTGKPYFWGGRGNWQRLPTIPMELLILWQSMLNQDTEKVIKVDGGNNASWDEIKSALYSISPDCDRKTWIDCGMAIHSTGHPDGFALWDEWSSTSGEKYKKQEMTSQWRSFKPTEAGIKLGTLIHHAIEAGWKRPMPDAAHLFAQVAPVKVDVRPPLKKHTLADLQSARITPREIMPGLLYADVRMTFAAGGVGKTTERLASMVLAGLREPLYGHQGAFPIRSVLITREDSAETLLGRLREVCKALRLTDAEMETALERIRIFDLSSIPFRLIKITSDMVMPDMDAINWLIDELADFRPDWVIFDPLISFGVGESRVNDAEQGFIEAFRIIRNRLDCCVEGIHHVGKVNAREKSLDQYSGRGGSALPDGARMVVVMQPLTPAEWSKATSQPLGEDETGLVMAFPKLSYTKPKEPVYIRRRGFSFQMVFNVTRTADEQRRDNLEQLVKFVESEMAATPPRWHSATDLEKLAGVVGLSRSEIRVAVCDLKTDPRFSYHEANGRKCYFESATPAATLGRGIEK